MILNNKNISIYRQYWIFLFVAPLILLLLSMSISWSRYESIQEANKNIYSEKSDQIEEIFDDIFNFINKYSSIAGAKIAKLDNITPHKIGAILQETASVANVIQDTFQLNLFDFTTSEGWVVASTADGAIENPMFVDKKTRLWRQLASVEPWKAHISYPDWSIMSSRGVSSKIIPVGYGITDKNNKFIGYLSVGIDITKLTRKIRNSLNKNISVLILTKDFKKVSDIYLNTKEKNDDLEKDFSNFIMKLKDNDFKTGSLGKFSSNIKYGGVIFSSYRVMDHYPYIILFGRNDKIIKYDFEQNILPNILETIYIVIFLLILLYFFRNEVISPLVKLAQVARSISQGDLEVELPKAYNLESLALIESLDLVKTSLKNEKSLQIEISAINKSLEQKVQQRTVDLKQALDAKTDFLNNMSHEIRTPIHGFTNLSQGLVRHWNSFDDHKKLSIATHVADNAKRLALLISNLLDLSKFTANKMLMNFDEIDLNEIIDNVIEECNALYLNDKPIDIKFNRCENSYLVADEERIGQVLRNLFVNAIKFSPKNSTITASLKRVEEQNEVDKLYFVITDMGLGIPEKELEKIFEPFVQSTRTKTTAGGTGLGLGICRQIIDAHHGKIWADNNLKVGASFHFTIPVTQTQQNYQTLENKIDLDSSINDKKDITPSIKVLLIDDEEVCLTSMELLLIDSQYSLVTAKGGIEGLEYLQNNFNDINLVLLDLMMNDMHGLDVLGAIKKDPHLAKIPIILQSGSSNQKEIEKAYEMGIFSHLRKPYQKDEVIIEIKRALNKDL